VSPPASRARAAALRERLESIYTRYHRADLIEPDPLQWVRRFPDLRDRELVALLAAALAFGRVSHILASLEKLLPRMGGRPAEWLREASDAQVARVCAGCRHRWTTPDEMANLLRAVRGMQRAEGSMAAAWAGSIRPGDRDAHDTLARWVALLDAHGLAPDNSMIPRPERSSACKRLHLFLRWTIRCDAVDPGGWPDVPARLVVPLDVHMHRMARAMGLTRRRAADLRTARQITAAYARICPEDPVRYDFALTRMPIHEGLGAAEVRRRLRPGG